ncbi:rhodanese-like domain-containing protein [Ahniella affigens]|nr:rhodanese-like domain-containing protein [Ahniella affigens]
MYQHIAFYKFTPLQDLPSLQATLSAWCDALLGSVLLAAEGINGMLAGQAEALDAFEAKLTDPGFCNGVFVGTVFKRTDSATQPFQRMKVRIRPEIVPLGIVGVNGADTGIDVPPAEWRRLIRRDDVVVIDNRNHFEFEYGHFVGALDPGVTNFREFSEWIQERLPAWQAEGKTIAMYCTGGIRCEKTSAWMKQTLGLPVYQLQGGILNYFMQQPDAEQDYVGSCFVFDQREALTPDLKAIRRDESA